MKEQLLDDEEEKDLTREEKIQNRIDTLSLSYEKGSGGLYNVFVLQWTSLSGLLKEGETLFLDRIDVTGQTEKAFLSVDQSVYKDTRIPSQLDVVYKYQLRVQLESKTLKSASSIEGKTKGEPFDPFSVKPLKPEAIGVERYLNGFRITWKDLSNNELKFEIEKCVSILREDYYQDGSTYTYEDCVRSGDMITIDTSMDPVFTGHREYFDQNGLRLSTYEDIESQGFTSAGYCYSIRAVNTKGASDWSYTECERF